MNKLAYATSLMMPALLAHAGEAIEQIKDTGAEPEIRIENVRGRIDIHAWDKNQVKVKGTLDDQAEKFTFESSEDLVKIIVDAPSRAEQWDQSWGASRGSYLTIYLPTQASLAAEGFSTDFSVTGVAGAIKVETVSGDIDVDGNRSRIDLESVSGDVDIKDHEGIVFVESVSGDIDYHGIATRIELESVQGDIRVNNSGSLQEGEFNSVSGDIETKTNTDKRTNIEYNAVSGDVDIDFQSQLNAVVEIETMSGDIVNGLTEATPNRKRWVGSSLVFTVEEGLGEVNISTVSGNVKIK